MTLYVPVCTCAQPGINGCAAHTWPELKHTTTVEVARTIAAGGRFTAAEAQRVADAFLWLLDDGGDVAQSVDRFFRDGEP